MSQALVRILIFLIESMLVSAMTIASVNLPTKQEIAEPQGSLTKVDPTSKDSKGSDTYLAIAATIVVALVSLSLYKNNLINFLVPLCDKLLENQNRRSPVHEDQKINSEPVKESKPVTKKNQNDKEKKVTGDTNDKISIEDFRKEPKSGSSSDKISIEDFRKGLKSGSSSASFLDIKKTPKSLQEPVRTHLGQALAKKDKNLKIVFYVPSGELEKYKETVKALIKKEKEGLIGSEQNRDELKKYEPEYQIIEEDRILKEDKHVRHGNLDHKQRMVIYMTGNLRGSR